MTMNDPLDGAAPWKALFKFASTLEDAFCAAVEDNNVSMEYCTVYNPMSAAALIAVVESDPAGNRTASG